MASDEAPERRHFLQIRDDHVPDACCAPSHATIDHRGQDFGELGRALLRLKPCSEPPTGHRAAIFRHRCVGGGIRHTLVTGDAVLMFETGPFRTPMARDG